MIRVENLSYSFPEKDLYQKISFHIEEGQHAALIGSNGSGKTTLVDMIMNDEEYLYTGKIIRKENLRIGYVSQFVSHDKEIRQDVYAYLSEDFQAMLKEQEEICLEMETATDFDEIMERYQQSLDAFAAVDGENYETNIYKELKLAGLTHLEHVPVAAISGGEFKLVQIIRQMMRYPGLLIMDEPDVFLDFENLAGLRNLIVSYPGTILVITHNRFVLNQCFDKILHLEHADLQEFEGSYMDYQVALLSKKVELQEGAARDQAEIERQQKLVNRMRKEATYIDNSAKGRQLNARVSLLERLKAKAIKAPFVEVREPEIHLYDPGKCREESLASGRSADVDEITLSAADCPEKSKLSAEKDIALRVTDYKLAFDQVLLEHVNFELEAGAKVALVGPNGTGKTTLLHDIYRKEKDRIRIGYMSQIYGNLYQENDTVYTAFEQLGFDTVRQVEEFLSGYCFTTDMVEQRICDLSGGERNLLQLALLHQKNADVLLLDEPTSHLDIYAQIALERAIREYPGTILMVSHDFYTIANCVDYVLYVDQKTVRRMSGRAFRKMIYKKHFPSSYLELEKEKLELEQRIQALLRDNDYEKAKAVCEKLAAVVDKM